MRYLGAYRFLFEHPKWGILLLIGAVCQFVPLVGPVVLMGYIYSVIEAKHRHGDAAFPDFDFNQLGAYLTRGVWPFLAAIVAALPLMILLVPAFFGMFFLQVASARTNEPPVAGIILIVLCGIAFGLLSIVWQFATTKRFDAADFPRFLELLPRDIGGRPLRHALDVRHASFMTPEFIALARRYRAAIVFTDSRDYPSFADLSADFVYARLMRSTASVKTGYQRKAIVQWSQHAQTWAQGDEPGDLPRVSGSDEDASRGTTKDPSPAPRDVFVLFINGAKERAPAAARELLKQLGA